MAVITVFGASVDTDNKTATLPTPGGGSVVIDGAQGTVTVNEADGTSTTIGGVGSLPPMPFTGHYMRGRVLYPLAPGGVLNGVSGATIAIIPVGNPGGTITMTTDHAGFYAGSTNTTFTDQLFTANVTLGTKSVTNVPLFYNPFAAEFLPLIVPFDWIEPATPVRNFRRRGNIFDLHPVAKAALSDFIFTNFLPSAHGGMVVDIHMPQIDHIMALFIDHKTYVWELEKALLRAGMPQFVPLQVWEPIDDIPPGFDRVHVTALMRNTGNPLYQNINPLYNSIKSEFRPLIPNPLKPANMAAANFPTAHDLALYIGRSAASALGSFHFNAHFLPGGPFLDMMFAAGAVLFWPVHALIVEIYDTWLSTIFTGTNRANGVAVRLVEGKPYHTLLAVTERGELWQSYQRELVNERNDLTLLDAQTAVRAIFDPEKILKRNPPIWPHWSHWEQVDVDCVIADFKLVTDLEGRWVMLAKDERDQLCLIWVDACGKYHCTHLQTAPVRGFAIAVAKDGTLQIVFSERSTPVLQFGSETRAGSREFTWTAKEIPFGFTFAGVAVISELIALRGVDNLVHVFAKRRTVKSTGRTLTRSGGKGGKEAGSGSDHGGHDHGSHDSGSKPASRAKATRHSPARSQLFDIRTPIPGTLFHAVRGFDGAWAVDDAAVGHRNFHDWTAANCHDDCIRVFGVDNDGDLYTTDLPVTPDKPQRSAPATMAGARAHRHAHAHDHNIATPTGTARLSDVVQKASAAPAWSQVDTNGRSITAVAACHNEDGWVQLFTVDTDGRVFHASEDVEWSNWNEIPLLEVMGTETLDIFAELDYTGRIKVYVHTGNENFLYMAEQEDTNSAEFIGWLNI